MEPAVKVGVNHKKIHRLWPEEGLRVLQRRRRKRVGCSTIDAPVADAPNTVWVVDFQFDVCQQGKALKMCSIWMNTPVNASADWSNDPSPQTRFIDHLEELIVQRG